MGRDGQASACLYAFDLLHLGREDLRPLELANGRGVLKKLVRKGAPALIFSEHMSAAEGEAMFHHACALGLEGIVSKRLDKLNLREIYERRGISGTGCRGSAFDSGLP